MNEETKKILQQSLKVLKSNNSLNKKDVRPVIVSIQRLIRQKRNTRGLKQA
jgi:hypothetical protein